MRAGQQTPAKGAHRARPPVDPAALVLEELSVLVAGLLRTTAGELDVHAPFLEMGADSLVLMQALRAVEKTFGVKLSLRQIFETHTSLAALAGHLAEAMPEDRRAELLARPGLAVATESARGNQDAREDCPPPGLPRTAATQPLGATAVAPASVPVPAAPGPAVDLSLAGLCRLQLQVFHQMVTQQLNLLQARRTPGGEPVPQGEMAGSRPRRDTSPVPAVTIRSERPDGGRDAGPGNGTTTPSGTAFRRNPPSQPSPSAAVSSSGPHPESPRGGERTIPLTEAQRQLVLLAQMSRDGSIAYNEPVVLKLEGRLDIDALRRAVQVLVDRHEALRSHIRARDNVLVIAPHRDVDVPVVDLSDRDNAENDERVARWFRTQAQAPFDLEHGPLVRLDVVKASRERHYLHLSAHHTVVDGATMGLLVDELGALYNAAVAGLPHSLPDPIQISDYQAWLQQSLPTQAWQDQRQFWLSRLAGHPPVPELPTDRPRPPRKTYRGQRQTLALDPALDEAIRRVGQRENCTLFMTLLAAYTVLLHRLADQEEILVGIPALGRSLPGGDRLVAYCAHLMPLGSDIRARPRFSAHLRSIRAALLDAYENQDVPFAEYLGSLEIVRDPSRAPLVDHIFNLDGKLPVPQMAGLAVAYHDQPVCTSRFEIGLNAVEIDDRLVLYCDYNTDLFDAETIDRLLTSSQTLLRGIVESPERDVLELPLLTAAERERILTDGSTHGQRVSDVPHAALHQFFEAQVEETPEATAVVLPESGSERRSRLSYAELNRRANQLAHWLRRRGVGPEVVVGGYIDRSVDMVVAVLGILKAGGAYLPLDPDSPRDRLDFILGDAGPRLVLSRDALRDALPDGAVEILCLDAAGEAIAREPGHNPQCLTTGDHLAYVIYTSGSTGRPKGTEVLHRNVTRLFTATADWFGFHGGDVWTLFHSLAFDFSVWELWGALAYGGTLVIVSHATSRTPAEFYKLLRAEGVTVLNQTPSAFRQLIQHEESLEEPAELALRLVISGGEALDPAMLRPWVARHGAERPRLVNMYGITETTVHVSYRPIGAEDLDRGRSVIGRPIPDLQVYILDRLGQPVPVGVRGELYVGGAGVARGYLRRPELTAARFVRDPFRRDPHARLYRTGDLGRSLPDGDIEYLGRCDHQVKIRGFRIEPGEIEAALASHPGVREAVVVAADDPQGHKRLVAYLVAEAGEQPPGTAALREFLRRKLPDYMIPAAFVPLDAIPLTAHGKVDRRALPTPDRAGAQDESYVAPRTAVEEVLAGIWSEVLNVERVGVHDNFYDLGGHSLLATQLLTQVRQAFRMELSIAQLFEAQTVAELAGRLAALEETPGRVEKMARLRLRVQGMSADEVAQALRRRAAGQPAPTGETV
ncbi:MAG: amino acid adenylation domain-containing protein [Acidimicrobiia bacterium]|nr:amino acid adenylation domain-containing protein [Acidimicrobiia bacterium]